MPTLSYRPIEPSDLAFAWALNQREVPRLGATSFEEFTRLVRISRVATFALVGGDPAGFLLGMTAEADYASPNFLWFRARYPRFVYVDRIAVWASHRRLGVGAGLYDAAIRHATAERLPVVCCEVNLEPPNPDSLAFHEALGFQRAGEQDAHGKRVAMLVLATPGI